MNWREHSIRAVRMGMLLHTQKKAEYPPRSTACGYTLAKSKLKSLHKIVRVLSTVASADEVNSQLSEYEQLQFKMCLNIWGE